MIFSDLLSLELKLTQIKGNCLRDNFFIPLGNLQINTRFGINVFVPFAFLSLASANCLHLSKRV